MARWLWSCEVGDVECGGYLEGRSVGLEEMLSVRGKKVGRKWEEKWEEKWEVLVSGPGEVVVVVFVVVSVDLFVFLPLCSVVTALPAVEASLLQHARIA